MTIHFARLKVGFPAPRKHPPDWAGCWKVYTICATSSSGSSTTLSDVNSLESEKDKSDARKTYVTLLGKAHTGEDFRALYDEKKCHEAHSFGYVTGNGQIDEIKIWRIWGSGKIRMYFLYLPGKRIVMLKTLAKRANKLDTSQSKALEALASDVLDSLQQGTFESREIL